MKALAALGLAWWSAAAWAGAPVRTAEPGVVELAEAGPDQDAAWQAVLAGKGSPGWPEALQAWLKRHPRGPLAALALAEQAALQDDLDQAAALLRRARSEGAGTEAGAAAALELARLEYAQERYESALAALEEADPWPRSQALEPEWLYWRAQSRLVLKGLQRARDDFQHLAAGWPQHPRAQAALLGQAECDAALKEYARAEPVFSQLARPGSPHAAQALWGWAGMKARQGDAEAARALYQRLKRDYPASFEAASVDERLAALPAPQAKAPTPTPAKRQWSVQVGAFARPAAAEQLAQRLRKQGYAVQVQARRADGRTLHLVKAGPYATRALAEQQAKRLASREKLPHRIVEE